MLITSSLFALMYLLVQYDAEEHIEPSPGFEFQFRQMIPDIKPEPPPPVDPPEYKKPDPPPPKPDDPLVDSVDPVRPPITVDQTALRGADGPPLSTCATTSCSHGRGQGGGQLVPTVRIEPQYPRRAALAGTEGWVKVAFTVTESGAVVDPRIMEAQPPRVFEQAVLRAIVKWKFRPQTRADGTPVRVRAVQRLEFKL